MIERRPHWRIVRRSVLTAVACCGLAATGLLLGQQQWQRAYDDYQQRRQASNTLERKYTAISEEIQRYHRHIRSFNRYRAAGYIGEETRLSWIEALQSINQELQLPVLNYDIAPQKKWDILALYNWHDESVEVYESTMTLTLRILDSNSFFAFFHQLAKRSRGLFEIRHCELQRAQNAASTVEQQSDTNVQCLLSWYSLRLSQPAD